MLNSTPMLSDRSYMRNDDFRGRTSALTWILCAIAAGFILQTFVTQLLTNHLPLVEAWAGLSLPDVHSGHLAAGLAMWAARLFSYGFVHAHLLHLLFTGVALYFFGRQLLPVLGARVFVALFFGILASGGLLWTAVHWAHPGSVPMLMGASPAVSGFLALFALLFPEQEITLLLLFIPVTVKPKYVALSALGFDLFFCVFYEVPGNLSPFDLAPAAHLGGMGAAWLYWRFCHEASWRSGSLRTAIELPKWIKRSPAAGGAAPAHFQVNVGTKEHLRAEVDRILDKINSQGFGALTADEKRLLDEAREQLSRR